MDLYFDIAGDQIDGARDYQEDAFLTAYLTDEAGDSKSSALIVLADGMGGHAAGNIASNLVVSTFNKHFTNAFGAREVPDILSDCLDISNNALRESIRETPALDGMGCTMVTAACSKGRLWWISVGDSHLYLIRDRELLKQNQDHSYGGYLDRMKAQGMGVEPEPGLSRNMLMSAVTGDEVAEIDCPQEAVTLLPGDRLIVASDGLDSLSKSGILQYSAWASTAKECVQALLKAVEDAGRPRQDNTTVVVVDVLDRTVTGTAEPAGDTEQTPTRTSAQTAAATEIASPPAKTEPLELVGQPDISHPAEPQTVPAVSRLPEPEDDAHETIHRRGGTFVALAALILIALAAGAWYFLVTPQGPPPRTEPAGEPPGAVVEQPAPEPAPELETVSDTPPEPEAVVRTETAPETPAPSPTTVIEEFQDTLAIGASGPVMVKLPAGTFEMGSGLSADADERPQHRVSVKAFAIGKFEVTNAEYRRFARATGRRAPAGADRLPVVSVTWEDAHAYAAWLARQSAKGYRLPSEAEWEYAARAGTTSLLWWGFEAGSGNAHCFDCKSGYDTGAPVEVGRFPASPFGLHDTAGNVLEWVEDCYMNTYQGAPVDGSVWQHGNCDYRVARGGGHETPAPSLYSSKRTKRRPAVPYEAIGFRVARDL